jgi:hypothetical protein
MDPFRVDPECARRESLERMGSTRVVGDGGNAGRLVDRDEIPGFA